MDDLVAGVDVGTTNTKVGVYRPDGTRLAVRAWPTPAGAAELVAGVLAALAETGRQVGRAPAAVGVAGMAETGVTVDAELTPLHPLIGWADPRGADAAGRLAAELGAQAVIDATGVSLSAKTPLARWRWLTESRPGLLGEGRYWLGAVDLVASTLVGTPVTDLTMAGRTGALDVPAGEYRSELLAAAGMTAARLPRIARPGQPAGRCTAAAARAAGLAPGTPVVLAGHDHLVVGYAAGARRAGTQADSLGTAEALVTVLDRPPPRVTAGSGMSWNRYVDGQRYCLISGFPGAGRLVDWFVAGFLDPAGAAQRGYSRFADLVAQVTERPTGIVVEPYLSGRAAPRPDPGRRLAVHGVRPDHRLADLALALLEGACMQVRWMAQAHTEHLGATATGTGTAVTGTVAAGGPTRNRAWMRVKAAVGGGVLDVVDEPDAACAGAALLAGWAGLGAAPPALPATRVSADPVEAVRYERFYTDRFRLVTDADRPVAERFRLEADADRPVDRLEGDRCPR